MIKVHYDFFLILQIFENAEIEQGYNMKIFSARLTNTKSLFEVTDFAVRKEKLK